METKEIIENNKLIALFMGIEVNNNNVLIPYHFGNEHINRLPKEGGFFEGDVSDLGYHYDWNLLMPVVEKAMQTDMHSEGIENLLNSMTSAFHNVSIDELYKAVIEFIKWYNAKNR